MLSKKLRNKNVEIFKKIEEFIKKNNKKHSEIKNKEEIILEKRFYILYGEKKNEGYKKFIRNLKLKNYNDALKEFILEEINYNDLKKTLKKYEIVIPKKKNMKEVNNFFKRNSTIKSGVFKLEKNINNEIKKINFDDDNKKTVEFKRSKFKVEKKKINNGLTFGKKNNGKKINDLIKNKLNKLEKEKKDKKLKKKKESSRSIKYEFDSKKKNKAKKIFEINSTLESKLSSKSFSKCSNSSDSDSESKTDKNFETNFSLNSNLSSKKNFETNFSANSSLSSKSFSNPKSSSNSDSESSNSDSSDSSDNSEIKKYETTKYLSNFGSIGTIYYGV